MGTTSVTVRNIPAEVHRALRVQAAKHGTSLQAELLMILNNAVKPKERMKLGDLLEDIGRSVNLTDEEMKFFQRDKPPAPAASFE